MQVQTHIQRCKNGKNIIPGKIAFVLPATSKIYFFVMTNTILENVGNGMFYSGKKWECVVLLLADSF